MGYPIYKLSEAAAYLVPPKAQDIEQAIKRMNPKDLPAALQKEYWAAQHARLKFEEDQGDLWRTSDVVATLSEVFKTARMSILLMRDQVERNTTLTDKQRDTIQTLIDSTLNDLAESLVERFKNEPTRKFDTGWDEPETPSADAEDEAL